MKIKIKTNQSGFSLVELIVTVSILAITTTIMLTGYTQSRQNSFLKQTAQDIAMTIRQAQAYGLSVKKFDADIYPAYGVFFNLAAPSSFVLFGDKDGDNIYDEADGEQVKNFSIGTKDIIYELCKTESGAENCGISSASVIFRRPNPIVKLTDEIGTSSFSDVSIKIRSMGGQTKTIKVWTNGYIQVN